MATNRNPNHKPFASIGDTPVYVCGDPLTMRGEEWVTLAPQDGSDERLWEFSLTTGRLIQTDDGSGS